MFFHSAIENNTVRYFAWYSYFITCPVVSASVLAWFITGRYIYVWNLPFLNNVID